MILYHASQERNLTVLVPHESTHGKRYVYAVKSRLMAMLFGAPKDDFDILIDEKDGKPILYECYPDAIRKVYSGQSCALYEVKGDGFLTDQTGWEQELVSEEPAAVVRETKVDDIYRAITEEARRGNCILHHYSYDKTYRAMLREELLARIHAFGITIEQMSRDVRFREYFSELLGDSGDDLK